MQIKLFDESVYEEKIPFQMEWDCTGWHSTAPTFKRLLDETDAKLVIEIGTWKGASAIHMAKTKLDCRVITIDTHLGGRDHLRSDLPQDKIPRCAGYPIMYYQCLHNIKRAELTKRITMIPAPSNIAAGLLAEMGVQCDLCYVDGSHDYADALADMRAYWPLVRKGGIMFGDDIGFTSVRQAVDEFAGATGTPFEIAEENFWIFRKL